VGLTLDDRIEGVSAGIAGLEPDLQTLFCEEAFFIGHVNRGGYRLRRNGEDNGIMPIGRPWPRLFPSAPTVAAQNNDGDNQQHRL
jgi:hypothetical protein